ncbi:MAG: TetR/AcrR family transcriptional regulator [Acidobacteria bacterium]|nr:TetR/AcrR family transcriptional regulator [Acidobacteriota bacterium]
MQRQQRILRAALECFTRLGFNATTLEEIRSRSGASIGSIYHHFSSKEELAAALYVEGLRDYQEGLVAELRRHKGCACGIRATVRYHLRWIAKHPNWARYLLEMRRAESVAAVEENIQAMNRNFFGEIRRWREPHLKRGVLKRLPEELYIALIAGPSQEFARRWLAGRAKIDITRATEVLADAAWNALRTKGGG